MDNLRPALEQALRALRAARVSALHPDSVSLYAAAITRAEAALEQEEQREQDARAEQIMSEIWAQPDQTYEYIAAKLAENMQKAMKNRARVSIEAVRSALEQDEQELRTRSVSVPSGTTPPAKIESVTLLPNDVDAIEFLTRQRDVLLQALRTAADSQDELVKSLRAMVEKNHG